MTDVNNLLEKSYQKLALKQAASTEDLSTILFSLLKKAKKNTNFLYAPTLTLSILNTLNLTGKESLKIKVAKKIALDNLTKLDNTLSLIAQSDYLTLSTGVWYNKDYVLKEKYSRLSTPNKSFTIQPFDSKKTYNEWVSTSTKGLIPESSNASLNNPVALSLLLSSALHYKAKWEIPFSPDKTVPKTFYLNNISNTDKVECDFMVHTDKFAHIDAADYLSARLYYKDRDYSLLLIMPKKESLDSFVATLNNEKIYKVGSVLGVSKVKLELPKLSLATEIDLQKELFPLGYDFLGDITTDTDLFETQEPCVLTSWTQKVVLNMDEEGTEAAALEEMTLSRGISITPTVSFNRPYVFMLQHKYLPVPLIAGFVSNPE